MTRSLKPTGKRAIVGLELILLGVSKKLLIADLPLQPAIPLVVGAHCLGRYVGSLAAASEGIRYIRPP
jgi:hypothetical protein